MAPRKRPWFRFYVEAIWDRKLRRLSPSHRWLWVAILASARQSPLPGHLLLSHSEGSVPMAIEDIADAAALGSAVVRKGLKALADLGLMERDPDLDAWFVTKWNERQYESDTSTDRTSKHRSKNGHKPPDGTPPENREQKTDADMSQSPPPLTDISPGVDDGGGGEEIQAFLRSKGIPADIAAEAVTRAEVVAAEPGAVTSLRAYALRRAEKLLEDRERAESDSEETRERRRAAGFVICPGCGKEFHKLYEQCPECGEELQPEIAVTP